MAYNYVAMGGPTGLVRSNQQKIGKQNDKYNKRIKINNNKSIIIQMNTYIFLN